MRPIVYANINYAVNYLDASVAAKHKLWLARYNNGNDSTGLDPQTIQPDLASFHPNPYGHCPERWPAVCPASCVSPHAPCG